MSSPRFPTIELKTGRHDRPFKFAYLTMGVMAGIERRIRDRRLADVDAACEGFEESERLAARLECIRDVIDISVVLIHGKTMAGLIDTLTESLVLGEPDHEWTAERVAQTFTLDEILSLKQQISAASLPEPEKEKGKDEDGSGNAPAPASPEPPPAEEQPGPVPDPAPQA